MRQNFYGSNKNAAKQKIILFTIRQNEFFFFFNFFFTLYWLATFFSWPGTDGTNEWKNPWWIFVPCYTRKRSGLHKQKAGRKGQGGVPLLSTSFYFTCSLVRSDTKHFCSRWFFLSLLLVLALSQLLSFLLAPVAFFLYKRFIQVAISTLCHVWRFSFLRSSSHTMHAAGYKCDFKYI